MKVGEFHWSDGWYFKRLDTGSVRIVKVIDQDHVISTVIPAAEWASIISFASAKGEPRNYQAAVAFHMEP